MREGNFEAVGETREGYIQMRVRSGQVFESLQASLNDRGLQPGDGIAVETCSIGQKARYSACCCRQPGVGINAQVQIFLFSGHGC